ncbi:hypothetical protein LTS18_005891 [Coniosporium uncinatum]|uniref:Uncharacterized protein n=1 Tax=Coniosporium uncinatum TaxID=93489 RepID=A0ACC3DXF0_9PEZI|nr:hypothetical protein LTS18_005891 [Coniosporium uncinatum]
MFPVLLLAGASNHVTAETALSVRLDRAKEAVNVMQNIFWKGDAIGYWGQAGWWNQANILVALADMQKACPECQLTNKVWYQTFVGAHKW